MAVATLSDLFAALDRGNGDALLGTAECQWLDFKQSPYRLDAPDERLELAKDVTALCNSGGGVLVIGYETRRDPSSALDVAVTYERVPKARVDQSQYADVVDVVKVKQQTYPPLRGLGLRWWLEDTDRGILTIEVPRAAETDYPVLVAKAREEGSRREILLGLFERRNDQVDHLLPSQLHSQIQLGRLVQRLGLPPSALNPSQHSGPTEQERQSQLVTDTRDVGLEGHRRYFLQAWPASAVQVRGLHERGPNDLRTILPYPPFIRSPGFGFAPGKEPTLIAGGGLRSMQRRGSMSLLRDGLLTQIVTAGGDFLAWGTGVDTRLNPLALTESTFEFARFFIEQVLPRCEPQPGAWQLVGGMSDLDEDGEMTYLVSGRVNDGWFTQSEPVPDPSFVFGPLRFSTEPPGVVALHVMREIYTRFGLEESLIGNVQEGSIAPEQF